MWYEYRHVMTLFLSLSSLSHTHTDTHTHTHPYLKQRAACVSIQRASVNNAVLKVAARRELERRTGGWTPSTDTPARAPHRPTTLPRQRLPLSASSIRSLNTTGAELQRWQAQGGRRPFLSPYSKQWWAIKTLHTLSERYAFKYFTHILHMQFIHTWLLGATTSGSCCFRGN